MTGPGRLIVAAVATFAAQAVSWAPPRAGATAEPPVPSPELRLSDKPGLGCCCMSRPISPSSPKCSYGLLEEKCRTAGKVLADPGTTWTPGKCPQP